MMLSGNSLRQAVHTHFASVHQTVKLVAALLRVASVTEGLAERESNYYIFIIIVYYAEAAQHTDNRH